MTTPVHLPRSSLYRVEAIILRQMPLGEADRLVTFYTREVGKMRASARGARRIKSRLAGHIEPLTHVSLLMVRGASLDIMSQAQTLASFVLLRENLGRTARALYAAELVDLFTEEQEPHRTLFQLLLETLHLLAESGEADLVLRRFEMQLLGLVGYRPQVSACTSCGGPLPEGATLRFSAAWGGLLCPACSSKDEMARRLAAEEITALVALQSAGMASVERLRLSAEVNRNLGHLLRWYVQSILERQVRSGVFLDSLG